MGKLTHGYDTHRHNVAASQAKEWIEIIQAKMAQFLKVAKSEIRQSLSVRNSLAATAVLVLAAVGVHAISAKVATTESVYRVYIDGQYLGIVRDKGLVEEQMAALGPKMKANVQFESVNQAVQATNELSVAKALVDSTKTMVDQVAIRVNGKDIVYVKDAATAQAIINKLKSQYANYGTHTQVKLADQVDFVPLHDDQQNITPADLAYSMIVDGTQQKRTYIVSRGDSLWDIASKNNMSVEQLQQANPDIDNINDIAEGQQINLVAAAPLINVQTIDQEEHDITTNYDIQYQDDDTLPSGVQKVVQPGHTGKKHQVVRVTRKNGAIVNQQVLSETVLSNPQTEIIARGTSSTATYSGSYDGSVSGDWAYPVAGGYVSSPFGATDGRSKPHPGIDIATATGTPVYASNDGVVIQAADLNDGYGNCIRISHGNGVVTIYAHLSSYDVRVGQTVQRGQQIGGVGMTGDATGPHLHYEVHVNGQLVNPGPYM